jgi:hypothetical protein
MTAVQTPLSPNAKRKRNLRTLIIILAALFVAGGLGGFIAGYIDGGIEAETGRTPIYDLVVRSALGFWLIVAAGVIGGLIGLWGAVRWYVNIDEAAQRAHLDAWFWGASVAMLIPMAFAMAALVLPGSEWAPLEALPFTKTQMAAAGVFGFYGVLILGYGVAWIGWWLRRR